MDACLSQELVHRYLSGNCSEDEHIAIGMHLTKCQSCRLQVESIQSNADISGQPVVVKTDDKSSVNSYYKKTRTYVNPDEYATKLMSQVPSFLHTSPAPAAPTRSIIEGYKILEQLPLGGQAVVYKAVQESTKRVVALKVLLQGPQISERAQYRFEREVDLAASLKHPNIVTIYDSGIAKGQYYFAMEYIVGKPLDEYVQGEKLPLRKTMELFSKICSAVAYAHQRGVIHRDLKPGNILVDADGEPHILDFGLAKVVDSSEHTTPESVTISIPGKVMGTLAFMSPEQASGQSDAVDVRTDVYSIGMILYKILTGNFPYDMNGAMLKILRNIQEIEPTRPSKIIPHFNSEVEAIIMRALDKELSHRYQSAAHIQQDIENWLKGLPISVKSDSSIYLLYKIISRHRYTSAIVVMLLIIIFGFSCFYYQLYNKLRVTNVSLKNTIQSLDNKSAEWMTLAINVSFADFLQALHANRLQQIRYIIRHIPNGSREKNAVVFLLDKRPLIDKEAEFRQKLGKSESHFVEFVIAEHHLKDGNQVEAIKAYQRALSHEAHLKKDRWLAIQAKSRLYELANEGRQDKTFADN